MRILVINSGSSSIKYKLFDMPGEDEAAKGLIEHIGEKSSKIRDHQMGLSMILAEINGSASFTINPERSRRVNSVSAVGHRVVHGAEKFQKPTLINDEVIRDIRKCCAIAPLHNPANLSGILACKKLLPGVPQVAVFDTAFHHTLPAHAYIYGLPFEYYKRFGIRKYGFHGTSHEYVAREAAGILKRPLDELKLISCHLGNGCSITAVNKGKSVDTSMGFTPLEGLVMGTRCGDIDPALVTYIMHKKKFNIGQIEDILNKLSGLKGISGISNDMRLIEKKAIAGNKRCRLAREIFAYRIKKYIGAYTAVMGGCDAIVFTAGIGENQKSMRRRICMGVFSNLKKSPRVLVIPTNEELMIARQAYKLVHLQGGSDEKSGDDYCAGKFPGRRAFWAQGDFKELRR